MLRRTGIFYGPPTEMYEKYIQRIAERDIRRHPRDGWLRDDGNIESSQIQQLAPGREELIRPINKVGKAEYARTIYDIPRAPSEWMDPLPRKCVVEFT